MRPGSDTNHFYRHLVRRSELVEPHFCSQRTLHILPRDKFAFTCWETTLDEWEAPSQKVGYGSIKFRSVMSRTNNSFQFLVEKVNSVVCTCMIAHVCVVLMRRQVVHARYVLLLCFPVIQMCYSVSLCEFDITYLWRVATCVTDLCFFFVCFRAQVYSCRKVSSSVCFLDGLTCNEKLQVWG